MNKSKGFTIIELIVVIAIIAILSGIVLVNVTGYLNKAKVAKIRTNIANFQTGMAVCFAETATYLNCATNTSYIPATLSADITSAGGALVTTATATATGYCASSALPGGGNVCVDASGATKSTATSICTTTLTACPN